MSKLLYRLGGGCARHPLPVIAIWLVVVIGVVGATTAIGTETSDNLTLPGTGSTEATDLLDEHLPNQANGSNPIVLASDHAKLSSGANSKVVKRTVKSIEGTPHVIKAVSPLSDAGSGALSKDGKIGYIAVTLDLAPGDLDEAEANAVIDAADPARDAGLQVAAGGYLGQDVSRPSTHASEVIGILAAIVILLIAFGTAVAMAMPIVTAILGLIVGLSLIGLIGHVVAVPSVAPTLGTMIGLGVGIDYSLFIVTRYRKRLGEGLDVDEAVARSCATSGGAVAFAGATVVIALLSLVLAGIPIVSALGYSAAVMVVVAMCAALTLLPALLGLLGHRIESLRIPHHPARNDDRSDGWTRWADAVGRHRWTAIVVAVAVLAGLAWPTLDMTLGQQDVGQLPEDTTARQAYDLLDEGFGPGTNGPLLIAVDFKPPAHNDQKQLNQLHSQQQQAKQKQQQEIEQQTQALVAQGVPSEQAQQEATQQVEAQSAPSSKQQQHTQQQESFLKSTASDPRLVKLQNKIKKAGNTKSVSPAKVDSSGRAAVFTVVPNSAPSARSTQDLVVHLRDDVIPTALSGTQVTAYVGGTTAGYVDLADRISEKLVGVIAIVVGLSFLLLLIAFRSLVVPLTAAAMNLLSVAASYGVLTAVFEKGWGDELIGLAHPVPIVSYVPLLMFAILFGLSMDYQVFLVSRIGELYHHTNDNLRSVVDGLATSAKVITSAALIMVAVFTSFVVNGDPTVKQFGLGMAVAIAIDATIVRCLLVPAVMVALGRNNWWIPGWLDRVVPRIGLESEASLPPLSATRTGEDRQAQPTGQNGDHTGQDARRRAAAKDDHT